MANETWKFVQTKSKHAMKQVLGIKNEAARMKVTPPLAVAPHELPSRPHEGGGGGDRGRTQRINKWGRNG